MFDYDLDWCNGQAWCDDFDLGGFGGMADMMIMPEVNLGEPSMEKVIASGWQEILLKRSMDADNNSLFGDLPFDISGLPFDISQYFKMSKPSVNMCQWRYQYESSGNDIEFLKIPPCQPNGCE